MTDTTGTAPTPEISEPTPPQPSTSPAKERSGGSLVQYLERYALILITVVVAIFFAVTPPSSAAFTTMDNINVVLGNNAVTSMIALAALFPLACNFFDFSIGAIAVLSSVVCAGLQVKSGLPLWLAIVIAMAISIVIGLVNGRLVTTFKMSPFVTTLGMATLLSGVTIWYCNGTTFTLDANSKLISFCSASWSGIPAVFVVVLVMAAVVWYVFRHTPYGRSLYAIGSNVTSARLVGMPVDGNVRVAFVMASAISGLAGIMYLGRQGSALAVDGGSLLFPALAAVFLGATAITPGFFNVVGTIVSAIFVSLTVSGLTLMGASGWATNVFNGGALLVAVGLSTYLGRRKLRGRA